MNKFSFDARQQEDRSPLSSGESSDESSSVEVAGPSHHIQEQIARRQRQTQPSQPPSSSSSSSQQHQQSTPANKKQDSQQPSQSIQVRDELGKAFANSSSLNSLLYQSPLVNLPHEVLMNLVQEGNVYRYHFAFLLIYAATISRKKFDFICESNQSYVFFH